MELYIGNIHDDTSAGELRRLFLPYTKRATQADFQVVRIFDEDTDSEEYIGRVKIQPNKLAIKATKKLHLSTLRGRSIVVREFLQRSANNDKRGVGWRARAWERDNRRRVERRRRNLRFSAVRELFVEG